MTIVEGRTLRSYKIVDLGYGQVRLRAHSVIVYISSNANTQFLCSRQVSVSSGQAFASLEHLLEFYYDNPYPESGSGHVPLRIM